MIPRSVGCQQHGIGVQIDPHVRGLFERLAKVRAEQQRLAKLEGTVCQPPLIQWRRLGAEMPPHASVEVERPVPADQLVDPIIIRFQLR
ncbi:MAG: hypothetical protein K6T86_08235 [Pirellulales bacterium]|nr:hypothetical protein [Pirellulales bacterium]